jgi:hypothetical protein
MEEEPFGARVSSRRVSPTELQFELNEIPSGSYDFYAVLRGPASFGSVGKESLRVGDRDVDGINIVLKPMVKIAGSILMKGAQSKLPQTLRIATPSMDSYPRLLFDQYSRTAVLPGSSGQFTVRYLIDGGRYGISLQGLPPDAYISDIRLGSQSILADGSFVASPTQDAFEIQIATPGGIVRGTVRDASGKPTEAAVAAVPDFARRRNSAFYKRTTTDPKGQFTIEGLAPGEYQLFAWPAPPPPRAEEDPAFLGLFERRSTRVSATVGIPTETNLQLIQ